MKKYMASYICHWPGQDVPCCGRHRGILKRLMAFMGGAPLSFTQAPEGSRCVNCHNEASKAANATNLG